MSDHISSTKVFSVKSGLLATCRDGAINAAKGRDLGTYDTGIAYHPNNRKVGTFHGGNIYSLSGEKVASYSNGTIYDRLGRDVGSYVGDEEGAAATFLLLQTAFTNEA